MKYRLNKAEAVPLTLYHVPQTKMINGRSLIVDRNYIRLAPDVVYETDDEAMLNFFRTYKRKVKYNKQLEDVLKTNDIPYEIEYCRSCGGKIRKISYMPIEVF